MNAPISQIAIRDRFRKELGDLSELAASIDDVGLLNPITVTPEMVLIAGERRLGACVALGWSEVPVNVVSNLDGARDALVAERDENTQRKEMLPSEKAALGMALEEFERPAARERMARGGDRGRQSRQSPGLSSEELRPTSDRHQSRDVAADAIGLSPATFTRMKTLMTTAANDSEPDEVRDAARDAVTAIDQGSSVRPEYDRVREVRKKTETITTEGLPKHGTSGQQREKWAQIAEYAAQNYTVADVARMFKMTEDGVRAGARREGIVFPVEKIIGHRKHFDSLDAGHDALQHLEGDESILDVIDYDDVTEEMARQWLERLKPPLRAIQKMKTTLKEIIHE